MLTREQNPVASSGKHGCIALLSTPSGCHAWRRVLCVLLLCRPSCVLRVISCGAEVGGTAACVHNVDFMSTPTVRDKFGVPQVVDQQSCCRHMRIEHIVFFEAFAFHGNVQGEFIVWYANNGHTQPLILTRLFWHLSLLRPQIPHCDVWAHHSSLYVVKRLS